MKKVIETPISYDDIKDLEVGDIIYLTGDLITCRDVAHRRLIDEKLELPIDVRDRAIFHAGPIVQAHDDGSYEMISVGPTTSMRMEKFEKEFIEQTGVRIIVGKGGMGKNTEEGCRENGAIHVVIPAGNAVWAAFRVKEIVDAQWKELGMPETLWHCKVEEFGPLIVSIDTNGNNIFESNKITFNERKEKVYKDIIKNVDYIK